MELSTPFSRLKNKTSKIKDWYSPEFVGVLCEELSKSKADLDSKKFKSLFSKNYLSLEMKDRIKLIAFLLNEYLEGDYLQKLKSLQNLLWEEYPTDTGVLNYGFYLYPISQFIEEYGVDHPVESLAFIKELTKRFTGEFCVRPIAKAHPELTLKTMKLWSKDENFHVRRLSSEGLRAKLPWGMKIDWVYAEPERTLPIYNKLRNDSSLYVRRSVANAIGDLIKINEPLAFKTLQAWQTKKQTPENLWVIRHAIRHPAKKNISKYVELRKTLKN